MKKIIHSNYIQKIPGFYLIKNQGLKTEWSIILHYDIVACAAATRAIGTLKGEQLT